MLLGRRRGNAPEEKEPTPLMGLCAPSPAPLPRQAFGGTTTTKSSNSTQRQKKDLSAKPA